MGALSDQMTNIALAVGNNILVPHISVVLIIRGYIFSLPSADVQKFAMLPSPNYKMAGQGIPKLFLTIKPLFDGDGNAFALNIWMRMEGYHCDANQPLLTLQKSIGSVPMVDYNNDSIVGWDHNGELVFRVDDESDKSYRKWYPLRQTSGSIIFQFTANARHITSDTPIGPRVDLRKNFGGLFGCPHHFLPHPPTAESDPTQKWDILLSWQLGGTPPGTRAIWTYGEGPDAIRRIAPLRELINSYIAVGPVQGTPRDQDNLDGSFGYYWFGNPPSRLLALESLMETLFSRMSSFFGDVPSSENPYKIFLRNATPASSFGGTGFTRCYVLEYDDRVLEYTTDAELTYMLAHEMVHNWPQMAVTPDALGYDDNNLTCGWYTEGLAEYYCTILPYRFGLYSEERFREAVNDMLAAYYTSPAISMSNDEMANRFWVDQDAERLPYKRGFVYHLIVDGQIRAMTGGSKSLDNVVMEMLHTGREGKPHGIKQYRDILALVVSRDEDSAVLLKLHDDMLAGKTLVPAEDNASLPGTYMRKDMEQVQRGYRVSEGDNRKIISVVPGSRAEAAGLRVGDEIADGGGGWEYYQASDHYERPLRLTITREGKKLQLQYRPRSFAPVECWQLLKDVS